MGNPLSSRPVPRWAPPALLGSIVVLALAPVVCSTGTRVPAGPEESAFRARVAPVLARYCQGCHAGKKPRGGLSLDSLAPDFDRNGAKWKEVLDRLADHTMPPRGRPRPTWQEARLVADWIASGLKAQ